MSVELTREPCAQATKAAETYAEEYPDFYHGSLGCGIGWSPLVLLVAQHCAQVEKYDGLIIKAQQIKEKFGGLRIYLGKSEIVEGVYRIEEDESYTKILNNGYTLICAEENCNLKIPRYVLRGITTAMASLSYITCERCGLPGELRSKTRMWHKTLCDECDAEDAEEQLARVEEYYVDMTEHHAKKTDQ